MNQTNKKWALILGGSSGLGLATAQKLAAHDYCLIIIYRDRRSDLEQIKEKFKTITSKGGVLKSYNIDVANTDKREEVINEIKSLLSPSEKIKVLVHSIAKGSLKPMYADDTNTLTQQDFLVTMHAMALSLYDWTKHLIKEGVFDSDARIISFTSEGNSRAWPGYGAVSAAKVTLEAITRNMALEFAPLGIKSNCIQAGTTQTKAFQMIPESEKLKANAIERSPFGRLTTPEDVANAVYLLTTDEAKWINGTVIKVDGGESLR